MRVLVTGATGYIGSAVAEALAASGHVVVGLARNEGKARALESLGYQTAPGDLSDPSTLCAAAKDVDGLVHAGFVKSPQGGTIDRAAVEALLSSLGSVGKPFVYTSGVWVMGDTGGRVAGEMFPLFPPPVVAWRPDVERLVMDSQERGVRGVVIRPAVVYGRGGGFPGQMVLQAREEGAVTIVGEGNNHWTCVHVDDLADLYTRCLDRSAGGELYLAAAGRPVTVRALAEAASHAAGAGGRVKVLTLEEARQSMGPLADALAMDQKVASTKAGRQLGWIAKRPGVLEELGSMAAANRP